MYKTIKKIKIILIFALQIILMSCNVNKSALSNNETLDTLDKNSNIDYKYYDVFGIEPAKIIFPKNQTVAQGLSVVVNDGEGNLIVFDGGRVEDADYLCSIIKDNGGVVDSWFITHIHDDHIGALYKILSDKRNDIVIKELYYDFADFDWYYEKMGNDAGIYTLFMNVINEYNSTYKNTDNEIKIRFGGDGNENKLWAYPLKYYDDEELKYSNKYKMQVMILNRHYELNQDPINNTSVVYVVTIDDTRILIPGDLGYEGGEELFKNQNYKFNIVVLSHHGQNGIDPKYYRGFNPKVVVWPTSKDIYENVNGKYYTDDTKNVLSEISNIAYQIKTYEETAVIR